MGVSSPLDYKSHWIFGKASGQIRAAFLELQMPQFHISEKFLHGPGCERKINSKIGINP